LYENFLESIEPPECCDDMLKGSRCRLEGGVNSRTWKITNSFAAVSPGPKSLDIFPDTPGNPENLGKCPDCPAYEGGIKLEIN
jgi:hypothetical protein